MSGPFRVGILLIDGFALMSYASVAEPLRAANLLAGQELYDVRNIAARGARAVSSGGAVVEATAEIGGDGEYDLVLVLAGGDPSSFTGERVFNWLRRLARMGVALGGVSGGPVVLAKAGLLRGRRMTVHWEHAAALLETVPGLRLERSLYVIDGKRITCAGGVAPMDLMHAIIETHHGPAFARQVSDWFLHTDIRPAAGQQRAGLVERVGSNDRAILDTVEAMESHVADPLTLAQLARAAAVSPRQLNRAFREKLGRTTMKYYRDIRLEAARRLIRNSALPMTEIALATGFASSSHLSKSYRQRYGQPPSALRSG
ncbi:MAG: GlxA family transcriptional regulator [Paracoccaceae bacterium]